ncbi:hypothetical protein ACFQ9U_22700 [Streptomyces sp. NPDC056568]|uniref:hypothetical protein n=1 Tax=Streptomyces sp. NPDC056568 TaxID=3345866 RepID=UPI00368127B1
MSVTFELQEFSNRREVGRKGTVGSFGEVVASRPKISIRESRRSGSYSEVVLRGDRLPATTYCGIGPGRPGLERACLLVAGAPVELHFNARALRSRSRALHLAHQGRAWTYTVSDHGRNATLEGQDVRILLRSGKSSAGKGTSSYGTVEGEADGVDLALAVIFEEVQTTALTSSGVVASALNRILTPRSTETFSPSGE